MTRGPQLPAMRLLRDRAIGRSALRRAALRRLLLAFALLVVGPTVVGPTRSAAAQDPARPPASDDAPGAASEWTTLSTSHRPQAPLAGIALVVDGGSAADRPGREGERWLWTHLLADLLAAAAPTGRARSVEPEVLPDRLVLRILTEPADLARTLADLSSLLAAPLPASEFERLRARLLESFAFESDSPVLEMQAERRALLDGFGSPWARRPRGTTVSIAGLSTEELDGVGEAIRAGARHLSVVGPIEGVAGLEAGTPQTASPVTPPWSGPLAWDRPDRIRIVRDVTNSWITVAFPVAADVPTTLLEFLAHRIEEEVATDPPDPGLFDAEVRILRRPGGRILVLDLAVLPEATERFEERLLGSPQVASTPVQADFFAWLRRRFRARLLLNEAAPERLAQRLAEDRLAGRAFPRDVEAEAWALSPELLSATAAALGPARVMVFGPSIAGER